MHLIALHAVEKTKHVGFYADEWTIDAGIKASEFSAEGCAEAIDEARRAIRHLRSRDHLHIAQAIYLTGPLPDELVRAGQAFGKRSGQAKRTD